MKMFILTIIGSSLFAFTASAHSVCQYRHTQSECLAERECSWVVDQITQRGSCLYVKPMRILELINR